MNIAKGSPCVVSSMDSKTSPPTNNLAGSVGKRWEIAGQFMDMFLNGT